MSNHSGAFSSLVNFWYRCAVPVATAAAIIVGAACSSNADDGLQWRGGFTMKTAVNCGGDSGVTCPDGLSCAVLLLKDGPTLPICVENAACEKQLTCESGTCVMLRETSPAQIACKR